MRLARASLPQAESPGEIERQDAQTSTPTQAHAHESLTSG
jgi:hypothetical protein